MAYEVRLYCTTGGLAAGAGFDSLLSRVSANGTELRLSDRSSGNGWVAAQLDRVAGGAAGCHLEFSAGSPLVAAMVADVVADDSSGRVSGADAIVTLTLSGEVDWTVVAAVWRSAKSLWEIVPHDDGSGFAVDLDELEKRGAPAHGGKVTEGVGNLRPVGSPEWWIASSSGKVGNDISRARRSGCA